MQNRATTRVAPTKEMGIFVEWLERLQTRANDPDCAVDAFSKNGLGTDLTGQKLIKIANPPASLEEIRAFEHEIGLTLPEEFIQVYSQVGNGGFGPGYGLESLKFILEGYFSLRNNSFLNGRIWAEYFLPFCEGGCDLMGVLNLRTGQVGSVHYEHLGAIPSENVEAVPLEEIIEWHSESLSAWFEAWLSGESLLGYSDNFYENRLSYLSLQYENQFDSENEGESHG